MMVSKLLRLALEELDLEAPDARAVHLVPTDEPEPEPAAS
jgi:hypothetical protein